MYCAEEDDPKLNLAASGALAQLTRASEKICQRTLETVSFVKVFKMCACSDDVEFQFRIFYILNNIMSQNKDLCAKIVESELMDVIVAMSRLHVEKERLRVSSELFNFFNLKLLNYKLKIGKTNCN